MRLMRVLLDEVECDVAPQSVAEAIAAGAALAQDRGRTIADVFVDGTRWTDDRLAGPESANAAEEVLLVTSDPAELVSQALADAAEALGDADTLQREAAELMQADQHVAAMDRLQPAIAIWQAVQQAVVKGAHLVGLDLDTIEVDGTPMKAAIDRLGERLRMIRSALAANDPVGLSDTLLYEMPEVVAEWRALLAHVQVLVGGERA